ncbi:FAD-linked oxidoreductase-like protein [Panaeolus papilionaceus]|nr:FAD-linked oxidoreductase-like protein [Panaeolus papilionaceus]
MLRRAYLRPSTLLRSTHTTRYIHTTRPRLNLNHASSREHGGRSWKLATTALVGTTALLTGTALYMDSNAYEPKTEDAHSTASLRELVRSYAVYTMCSIPALVDSSPGILSVLFSIPGIRQITEAFVRITFFEQFVGSDTAAECLPLLKNLRETNRGVLFAYSVEVDENEATGTSDGAHKRIVDEMIRCIEVAADFEQQQVGHASKARGGRTWVAVKMTALLPNADTLIAWSSQIVASRREPGTLSIDNKVPFPGSARTEDMESVLDPLSHPSKLTPEQTQDLRELYADLTRICQRAQEKGVKVIIDAEYSWYQPAIDALTLSLMRNFNSLASNRTNKDVQPLIYGTFQAYLRRTPIQLNLAIADAKKHNYSLGVKLVRGAYHPHEISAHDAAIAYDNEYGVSKHLELDSAGPRPSLSISPDTEPPVWREKRDTDEAYNRCAMMLIKAVRDDVVRCNGKVEAQSITENEKPTSSRGWFGWLWPSRALPVPVINNFTSSNKENTPSIGVLFGTHNWESCSVILKGLLANGLATRASDTPTSSTTSDPATQVPVIKLNDETVERVAIGQLYGMSDDLTDWVVGRTTASIPFVVKYVPYGALSEVMPYLSRRAIENKSVLGGGAAVHERRRAAREIWRRIFG